MNLFNSYIGSALPVFKRSHASEYCHSSLCVRGMTLLSVIPGLVLAYYTYSLHVGRATIRKHQSTELNNLVGKENSLA